VHRHDERVTRLVAAHIFWVPWKRIPVRRADDSFGLLLSALFFYHALRMRLTYFASSGRIWDRMPWEARLQFLQAVFFTFSGVGFLLDLANPRPGRIAHIVFLVFMGGVIGVAYGFASCGRLSFYRSW
jgi:hypothetical protein